MEHAATAPQAGARIAVPATVERRAPGAWGGFPRIQVGTRG
ncbi:MAG TPA: hypothetical protein VNL71_02740 [Chloroflexota bacterium]|nr:hypothetical protein [Chloroflexota bacterium]